MKRFMLLLTVLILVAALIPQPARVIYAQEEEEEGLLIWADATRAPALQPVAEAFTEEFGIPVTVQEMDMGDIRGNISVAGPAGEGPDIFIAAHDWIGELIQNGAVAPIDL